MLFDRLKSSHDVDFVNFVGQVRETPCKSLVYLIVVDPSIES